MKLLEILEKTFTIGDLLEYVDKLSNQVYGLESVNATQLEIQAARDKENIAFSFIADFAFFGNQETVGDILRAESAATHTLEEKGYMELPDGIDELPPFN